MKRLLVALGLIAAATIGMPSVSGAAESSGAGCREPEPERTYEDHQLVYRLAVDLTDCEWWDGSPIQLEADLERLTGLEGHGAWSGTVCGVGSDIRSRSYERRTKRAAPRVGVCEIQVTMEHPPFETAYYRGEVTFPGTGGQRTASFTALCGQPAGCLDLPADPMPTLAPIGDLVAGNDAA
jgi:hypothetical protein